MTVLVCACCGVTKETEYPQPIWAVELASWALEVGWVPLWGNSYVRIFCSKRCADANITKRGTLRSRVATLPQQGGGGDARDLDG